MKLDADFFISCFLLLFLSTSGQDTDEISADYYFGVGVLRSNQKSNPCENSDFQILCHIQCGGDHVCLGGKCYCFTALTSNKLISAQKETDKDSGEVSEYENDDVDEIDLSSKKTLAQWKQNPTLRHQIAHFCSNLKIARQCITKCMEQGKPAFCGKDHVCYCGHTETHVHAKTGEGHLDAYTEFKDMYNKYLLGLG